MESWKLILYGNWNIIKGKLKQQYANIADDDLQYIKGKETELMGRLIRLTGKTQQDLITWIEKTFSKPTAKKKAKV